MSNENSGAPIAGTSSIYKNLAKNAIGISSRTTRLPSIRSPRDLTLGASTSKRVFVPNIPVRREKRNKPQEKEDPKKTEGKQDSDLKNKRSNTHPRFQREFVSVQGAIFGEGLSTTAPKKGNLTVADVQSRVSHCKIKKEGNGSPMKTKKENNKIANDDDTYLSDNFIDDDDDEPDSENRSYPVNVPMNVPFKNSLNVTKFDPDGLPKGVSQPKFKTTIKQESSSSETVLSSPLEKLFKDLKIQTENPLVMFEFPAASDLPSMEGEHSTNPETVQNKQSSISDFPEGCVGKLQRLKSGKYRFLIDGISFDIVSVPNPMHQELISIQTEESETCVTELGQVQHMFKCIPHVTKILPSIR